MELGIEVLLSDSKRLASLKDKRVALLANVASVTSRLTHSLDELMSGKGLKLTALFGAQHGFRNVKQDNMQESEDFIDPIYQIPVFSLYGKVKRPTEKMLKSFDVMLIDLQDVGTRVYTFVTTLLTVLEEAAKHKKTVWVLDRPNPAGRPVEGMILKSGYESFVGAGPIPMRHGLTLGELGRFFVDHFKLDIDYEVIPMKNYKPNKAPDYGWPRELTWVNPSPNAATQSMALAYPGTVLLEGTTLSEARGTTHPLEMVGAPDTDQKKLFAVMKNLSPQWMEGCVLRSCYFEPTFHKHAGKLCEGFQIHVEPRFYNPQKFKPYRLIALWLKAIRHVYPNYKIWRDFSYEYLEKNRLPIDAISGGPGLRKWVDDPQASVADLEKILKQDEEIWLSTREKFLVY